MVTNHQRLVSGFYFIYFAAAAALIPNLPLIFDDAGLSGTAIGWLLALPPAIAILASPSWGALADITGRGRLLLTVGLAGAGAAAVALDGARTYVSALAVMVVFAVTIAPIIPFADAASISAIDNSNRYGRLRLWGSLGWGIAAPIAGWGVDRAGLGLAPVLFASGMLILIALSRWMPITTRPTRRVGNVRKALADSVAWAPLLGGTFVIGVSSGAVGYLFLLLRSLDASAATMGWALAIATSSELVAFSVAGRVIRRLGIGGTLVLGGVAGALRLLIYGLFPTLGWVLGAQLLHGLTFALPWAAGVTGAARLSPPGLATAGQGVFSAVSLGLGPTVGVVMAGYLLDRSTVSTMMSLLGIVVLIGTVVVMVPLLQANKA